MIERAGVCAAADVSSFAAVLMGDVEEFGLTKR